ncbi:unnamed protein product [Closterium sp. Naga37s-1]|nr:unnamed protein product [Closterium sp. Naga37s-1]
MANSMSSGKVVRLAVTDFLFTIVWAIGVSCTGATVAVLAPYVAADDETSVALLLAIAIVQIVGFGGAAAALGGASFNPLANLINYLADEADETALGLLLRFPAQAGGMVIGTMLTWEFIPESLKHTVNGPALPPGVSVLAGATAEFTLTFVLNLVVLWTLFLGPSSDLSKAFIMVTATIVAIAAGMGFSGPSMNPLFVSASPPSSLLHSHTRSHPCSHTLALPRSLSRAFLLNLVVLWTLFLGPKSDLSKAFIMVSATLVTVTADMGFSVPSMNPLFVNPLLSRPNIKGIHHGLCHSGRHRC